MDAETQGSKFVKGTATVATAWAYMGLCTEDRCWSASAAPHRTVLSCR